MSVLDGRSISTEVSDHPKRRYRTLGFKKEVLEQVSSLRGSGEVGAYLRSQGLFSSCIAQWRRQLERDQSSKRGPKGKSRHDLRKEIDSLKRRNATLEKKLNQTEAIIDIQKKILALEEDRQKSSNPE